jgi:hypothetical protein
MKRAMLTGLAALAVAGFAAGCGPAVAGSGGPAASGSTSSPRWASPSAPAAAITWQPGGSYTGPVPPADPIPGSRGGWQLPVFTDASGYKTQYTLRFGVPLHFAIPAQLIDCIRESYSSDLPPGQEVIPFEVQIHNLNNQQSPGGWPWVHAADSSGNDISVNSQGGVLYANGDCASSLGHTLPSGGSDAVFGFIGPATPAQLAGAVVTASPDGSYGPSHSIPLQRVLPHIANSWLIAHS